MILYMTFSRYFYNRIRYFLLMRLLRFKFYDGDIEQNKLRKSDMIKKLSFLAGAIALTLTAIPFAAQAQFNSSEPIVVAQRQKRGGWKNKLNLSEEQKAKMQEIKQNARTEMEKILTREQLDKLEAAKASGQKKRGVWRTLNLTEDQKAQIKKIRENKKAQFQAILTDEQKAQMQEMRQNRRENRSQAKGLKGKGKFKGLNLTDAQKADMQKIKESSREEMQKILTSEQLDKLEAAKASGQKKREVWGTLNLTDAQKAELKQLRENKKAQFEAILTDEQKAQIQEMKQMRQNRRNRR